MATASVSAIGRLPCPWLHTSIALHEAAAADHVVVTQCLVRGDVSAGGLVDLYMACNWLLMVRYLQYIDPHLPRPESASWRAWHTLPHLTTIVHGVLLPAC